MSQYRPRSAIRPQTNSPWDDPLYRSALAKAVLKNYTVPKQEYRRALAMVEQQIARTTGDDFDRLYVLVGSLKQQRQWPASPPVDPIARAQGRVEDLLKVMTDPVAPVAVSTNGYLDVGSGDGSITVAIGQALGLGPERIVGIDIFPQTTVTPGMMYLQARPDGDIPLNSDVIDFTTAFVSLHHVPDANTTIREIRRVSRHNAIVVIREHNVDSSVDTVAAAFLNLIHAMMMLYGIGEFALQTEGHSAQKKEILEYLATIRYRSQAQWDALFQQAGFDVVNHQTYDPNVSNPQRLYYGVYRAR